MNIQSAISQMRIGRKLGKISNEVQTRVLRRFAPRDTQLQWEAMMRLRSQIERDIQPIMKARKAAEAECYQIKFKVTETKSAPVKAAAPRKVRAELTGYEYTVAWWKEQDLKERQDRKAARLALA